MDSSISFTAGKICSLIFASFVPATLPSADEYEVSFDRSSLSIVISSKHLESYANTVVELVNSVATVIKIAVTFLNLNIPQYLSAFTC